MICAWTVYILCILSTLWFITPIQIIYCCELGAAILFIRKLGIYIIRLSRSIVYHAYNNNFTLSNEQRPATG